ncbi:MAG TPA: hypothetical protein VFS15_19930 [Kofleriaceae bacterium]|nr:hypothetical protein [Kofleriaceae bacterium]
MSEREIDQLAEVGRELPAIDLEDATAVRIAHRARRAVGRGLPARRFVEPVMIAVFELSLLGWTIVKLVEVLG